MTRTPWYVSRDVAAASVRVSSTSGGEWTGVSGDA